MIEGFSKALQHIATTNEIDKVLFCVDIMSASHFIWHVAECGRAKEDLIILVGIADVA